MEKMKISSDGIELIKKFEGCRLQAYRCPAGVPTIGYGHTKGVKMGDKITQEQADGFLREDVKPIEVLLNKLGINFRQEQFDALVSWIFNLGGGNFNSSTMKKRIVSDAGNLDITDQLVKWYNAGGRPLSGLKLRRIAEANMFLGEEIYYLDDNNNIKRR